MVDLDYFKKLIKETNAVDDKKEVYKKIKESKKQGLKGIGEGENRIFFYLTYLKTMIENSKIKQKDKQALYRMIDIAIEKNAVKELEEFITF